MRRLTVVLIVLNMTIVGLATTILTVPTVSGPSDEIMDTYHLSYRGRYEHGEGPDHLMGVEMVNGELLVTGALGAYFVDWSNVNSSYLTTYLEHFEPPFNFPTNQDDAPQSGIYFPKFYGSVTYDPGEGPKYIYINARYDGIYILSTNGTNLKPIDRIIQDRRFSEGLAIDGDYLYAAHHADGIEIYNLSDNPEYPTPVGNITTGFTDAWAVFPVGNTLYVADGRGGLKVVNITDKANPYTTWPVGPTTSPGNMIDVVVVGDYVYGACMGQGIAVYKKTDSMTNAYEQITVTMVNGTPQALALTDQEDIAVAARSWIHVIRPDGAGGFDLLASERMIRRSGDEDPLFVRIASDILAEGNKIVSASWDQVDVYELMDNSSEKEPDVDFGKQMVNFGVDGRSEDIKIENQGTARLRLEQPQIISKGNFQATLSDEWVNPGDFAWLNITHDGQGIDTRAQITIRTNDPDENPIRFMVYGKTQYFDVGESMPDFTLESCQGDFSGTTLNWTFTSFDMLDQIERARKVTFIAIVGSWCPACPPVIASIGYDIYERYQHRDDFGFYLMSQKEADGSMMHLMEKMKIHECFIFDEAGDTAKTALAQYDVNLPFGRSYIVDHEGIVRSVGKGYNPQAAWKILDGIFAEIDNATDLNAAFDPTWMLIAVVIVIVAVVCAIYVRARRREK